MSADSSEFPQPTTSTRVPGKQSGRRRCRSCCHSPYHSKALLFLALKKASQYSTDRNSSKFSGSRPSAMPTSNKGSLLKLDRRHEKAQCRVLLSSFGYSSSSTIQTLLAPAALQEPVHRVHLLRHAPLHSARALMGLENLNPHSGGQRARYFPDLAGAERGEAAGQEREGGREPSRGGCGSRTAGSAPAQCTPGTASRLCAMTARCAFRVCGYADELLRSTAPRSDKQLLWCRCFASAAASATRTLR